MLISNNYEQLIKISIKLNLNSNVYFYYMKCLCLVLSRVEQLCWTSPMIIKINTIIINNCSSQIFATIQDVKSSTSI